jgi:hypothetical protein
MISVKDAPKPRIRAAEAPASRPTTARPVENPSAR